MLRPSSGRRARSERAAAAAAAPPAPLWILTVSDSYKYSAQAALRDVSTAALEQGGAGSGFQGAAATSAAAWRLAHSPGRGRCTAARRTAAGPARTPRIAQSATAGRGHRRVSSGCGAQQHPAAPNKRAGKHLSLTTRTATNTHLPAAAVAAAAAAAPAATATAAVAAAVVERAAAAHLLPADDLRHLARALGCRVPALPAAAGREEGRPHQPRPQWAAQQQQQLGAGTRPVHSLVAGELGGLGGRVCAAQVPALAAYVAAHVLHVARGILALAPAARPARRWGATRQQEEQRHQS